MTSSTEPYQAAGEEENETYSFAMQLVMGSVLHMALQTAWELGIFEIIAKAGPGAKLSATDIAAQMPTKNQDAAIMVDRIARLLASHDVLRCSVVGVERLYTLSAVSYYFVRNQDGVSLAPVMALVQDKVFLDSWSQLKDAVLGGGIAFNRAHGTNAFEYPGLDARFNQVFNAAMFNISTVVMKKILESYKGFEGIKQLVDVGGNLGITLHYITSKYPNIKGINFDLPHVIQHAPSYPGVQHVAGDMFESVPEGDAIFMRWILHDWSDEHCLRLLKNCYKAIPDNGKVIVVDSVIPATPETTPSAKTSFLLDAQMMTQNPGGKERTKQEFMALATEAGFNSVEFECFVCDCWVMEFYKT
ncbi:caffeic acid 3-O-methyltransferase-like [Durio zibethinus]|uniref:Caffeic acid 3-O-methyltransferase-like n=1 Tax=Durio zibethinus TaxID=66656 RepID=A0A6P5ZYN3_DURZI|nr:caffeic acid 3-O-methyltransferase-like [Durio zibethinus]XP_022757630.1 caffeic acid 3-O-methyltransferase-like [Durio zibethinus]XP_022757631.1 caffeic acid 3-O-methyltransferase-like [Durio zibethinus]XP_022757632.1 caffeic acid 3-O-methyltransferase-like [Durio zibethinus]